MTPETYDMAVLNRKKLTSIRNEYREFEKMKRPNDDQFMHLRERVLNALHKEAERLEQEFAQL